MSKTTSDKNAEWYRGDCLFDLLDDISIVHRDSNGPLRIPVVDKIRE
jgi:translation elongation factor EF-1alpha